MESFCPSPFGCLQLDCSAIRLPGVLFLIVIGHGKLKNEQTVTTLYLWRSKWALWLLSLLSMTAIVSSCSFPWYFVSSVISFSVENEKWKTSFFTASLCTVWFGEIFSQVKHVSTSSEAAQNGSQPLGSKSGFCQKKKKKHGKCSPQKQRMGKMLAWNNIPRKMLCPNRPLDFCSCQQWIMWGRLYDVVCQLSFFFKL